MNAATPSAGGRREVQAVFTDMTRGRFQNSITQLFSRRPSAHAFAASIGVPTESPREGEKTA